MKKRMKEYCLTPRSPCEDWTDYQATGQLIGTGDDAETQFQLVKRYPSGSVVEVRTITKPVAGTVRIYLDGVEQLSGWSVDVTTGIVTFARRRRRASRSPPTSSSTCRCGSTPTTWR